MNVEIEANIRKNVPWAQLPTHIKQLLGNSGKEYEKHIIGFSIKNQLRYRGNLVRSVIRNERRYYERVIAFSRERLMLYPYHLADMIVKGLRITPFIYYVTVVERLMQTEKSYDTLPNFTAADCLRLLGIGRNEYIDLMNRSRSNKGRLFGKRNVKGLLPPVPIPIHMEPWWRVEVGMILEDDIKMVTSSEQQVIDLLIDFGSQTAGDLDYNIVSSLYRKGLVYLDVPMTAVDRVQVPPLQGFVMNRVMGDYFETLLYKIFVSIDEHTTVAELATVLEVETESVKQAVSLYCRLGFARKMESETEHARSRRHRSWADVPQPTTRCVDITPLTLDLNISSDTTSGTPSPPCDTPESPASGSLSRSGHRIAFLFDSTLTAFLMMGNLSPGLKKHAVTMFEVGKLCDESLDSFLTELEKVSALDAEGEGEARRYFDHAVILRSTVLALRKLPSPGLDLVRLESLHSLDEATCTRLLQKKYKLLVSMAPLSKEVRPISSLSPPHLGPAVPEVNSVWFKFFIYHMTGYGPPSLLLTKGTTLKQLPRMFLGYSRLVVAAWWHEPAVLPVASILHVNAALQYSAVLIQAYGVHQNAATQIVSFPFRSAEDAKISTGGRNWSEHPAVKNLTELIDLEHNCGFLTFVNIGVPDFGCTNRDPMVRLGRLPKAAVVPKSRITRNAARTAVAAAAAPVQQHSAERRGSNASSETTSICNENFSFGSSGAKETKAKGNVGTIDDAELRQKVLEEAEKLLQSPVESHFALTPVNQSETASPVNGVLSTDSAESPFTVTPSVNQNETLSPENGFTSADCTDILRQELEELDKEVLKVEVEKGGPAADTKMMSNVVKLESVMSIETLMSPSDENISMFTVISAAKETHEPPLKEEHRAENEVDNGAFGSNDGEEWTLLDCHFGIPLFDWDANTIICDSVLSGGLTGQTSLQNLTESSRKLGTALLEFISQCQYYPGENMGIIKRGRLTPLPRHNLVFDNGKVSEWTGK